MVQNVAMIRSHASQLYSINNFYFMSSEINVIVCIDTILNPAALEILVANDRFSDKLMERTG